MQLHLHIPQPQPKRPFPACFFSSKFGSAQCKSAQQLQMNSHITLGEREKRAKEGEEQILVHSAEDSPGASKMSAQISSNGRQMGSCWCPVKPPMPPLPLPKRCPPLPAPLLPWGSSSHLRAALPSLQRAQKLLTTHCKPDAFPETCPGQIRRS